MARRKNKKHHEEENGEAWLLPYSDLMTLLLAVFIVLFAVSKVDQTKTEEMADSFRKTMITDGGAGVLTNDGDSAVPLYQDGSGDGSDGSSENVTEEPSTDTETETESEGNSSGVLEQEEMDKLEKLQSKLDVIFKNQGVDASVSTHIDERGLIISLNNAILFDSGSAEIKPENQNLLIKVASTIKTLNNYILIEGHTDNQPISTSIYPSNLELSCARAANVVKLFIDKSNIDPEKLVPAGRGEYKPIADNSTEEGRSKNRRIDIIILSEKYDSLEEQISDVQSVQ